MKIEIEAPAFTCPNNMLIHIDKIFKGEYDVPVNFKSPIIIDCGANVGGFSVWASHRWPDSFIYAYEPNKEIFETLKKNTKDLNVECNDFGIGSPGLRALYHGLNNVGEASLYKNRVSSGMGQFVDVRNPLLLPKANIIKIDTEGCEVEILEPLIHEGREFDVILLEFHSAEDRRIIDNLLLDYVLLDAQLNLNPNIGTVKYLHKKHMDKL